MLTLEVQKREKGGLAAARKAGKLPAVLYGRHETSTPVSVDTKSFEKVFRSAGESSVITLSGLGEVKQALIHEVSVDPVSGVPVHADFYVIEKGQKVTVSIPLSFVGVSPAVKDLGGILVKVMHEIEIEVDPAQLPHEIEVDISKLTTLDSQIAIKDLKFPASAEVTLDQDEVVALISVAKDEPEEPASPVDLTAIETSVERGKKEDEEGAEKSE
jgi:large subunit ribosomal protein L25